MTTRPGATHTPAHCLPLWTSPSQPETRSSNEDGEAAQLIRNVQLRDILLAQPSEHFLNCLYKIVTMLKISETFAVYAESRAWFPEENMHC